MAPMKERQVTSMKQDESDGFQYREILITVDVPAPAAEKLGRAAAALARVSDPTHIDAFWIPPELMHVTLLHLGMVREDLVEIIQERVGEVTGKTAPFSCGLSRLTPHGEPNAETPEANVDALWGVVEDPDAHLAMLRDGLIEVLEEMGIEHHSPQPFEAHIPVALFAKFRDTREFGSVMLELDTEDLGELPVRELVVLENRASDGHRDQPFRPLKRLELRGQG